MGGSTHTVCTFGFPSRRKSGIVHLRYVFPPHSSSDPKSYKGQSHADKIVQVREELEKKAKAIVVMMLDEVAWLFNLRGSDIDFNPGELGRIFLRKVYMSDTVITTGT